MPPISAWWAKLLAPFSRQREELNPQKSRINGAYDTLVNKEIKEYNDDQDTEQLLQSAPNSRFKSSRTNFGKFAILHVCFIAFYSLIYLAAITRPRHQEEVIYSPALEAIKYVPVEFDGDLVIKNPWTGLPRPELDDAWRDLLQYVNFRVSGDVLKRLNRTSVPIPGESDGYFAQMAVMHELHCLKRVRQYIHYDYYFPNMTERDHIKDFLHTDHCLEILRQGVMCRGDVSLFTVDWTEDSKVPVADFSGPHKCVDWDLLYDWMRVNSVDMLRPGWLVHPTKGVVFPDGVGTHLGVKDPS